MARPRTKARKSYEELLEENAEKIQKHTEALQALEKERKELQAAKREEEMAELYQYMKENSLSAQEILESLKAVRPEEIPYGSKLYIRSSSGSFIYGYAVANDTGSGLVDGLIDVDLFYDTYEESKLNSVRWVDIYILE